MWDLPQRPLYRKELYNLYELLLEWRVPLLGQRKLSLTALP